MIPFKIFSQLIFALFLSTDPNVDQHLCAGIREARNYQALVEQAESIEQFDSKELLKVKCDF